ncbi:DNA alkylation repair enzyme [Mucilaginibacter frigoritolerans]|uniref:DNA alkylation repair enzyme n=1 Tax=Mucilaginibacter frigoritolerans TaxID=652788 RepID=A0A562TPN8_9SPHI|nr:DNA alkylation repair protein [Mucilaginibacter frigoritolerans]TWI95086.1 DNA alkylation repair enzyme [Mucilaginibacter frigoritolerans]
MKASANHHLTEIITHLRSLSGNVPMHRKESKKQYTFSGLDFSEQLVIWDRLWHTENNFWLRLHAYFFLERHLKKETELREMWPVIVEWQNQIDDWGLCDALAKVYTKILEVIPEEVYAQLQQWNTDTNLWKRRQSLVSLLYYSRTKKNYLSFDQISSLITPLLQDKEYYVQKGLGWTLRELHTVYPLPTMSYLNQHIKQVSSIAFTIAIEKMDIVQKDKFKALRKLRVSSV